LPYAKLIVCEYCSTAIFLNDGVVENAGKKSIAVELPSLFTIGIPMQWHNMSLTPRGCVTYSWGKGLWQEWWVQSSTGEDFWVSFDEGDIVIQRPLELDDLPAYDATEINQLHSVDSQEYKVTERGIGRCISFSGELPERLEEQEVHHYVHLSYSNKLITVEYADGETQAFSGEWIDPFDLKPFAT
jgi:hypothetical protein